MTNVVDPPAPVSATHSVDIQAAPESVWNALVDINRWPSLYPHITSARIEGAIAPGTTFRWKSGGVTITSTITEVVPSQRLVWTGRAIGTRAYHSWDLIAQGDTTTLSTTETFDGWLVRLMPGSMQKMLEKTLVSWLERIKFSAEGFH